MFPIINIGPIALQAAGFILLLSLIIGMWLTRKFSEKLGTNGDIIENSLLIGLIAGILAARIGFLLQNPSIFIENPLSLFSLRPSMFTPSFGLLVGGLTILIIFQKNHLPLWPTLDNLTPLIICLFIGMHLANFANGDGYGLPTSLPWGIELWQAIRHPVQLYAILMALIMLIWLIIQTEGLTFTGFLRSGILFAYTIAGLSIFTVITRTFISRKILIGKFDLIQIVGLLSLSAVLYLIYTRLYQPRKRIPVLISMGSNHHPEENLAGATEKIKEVLRLRRSSAKYLTEGVKDSQKESSFQNQVIEIETELPYSELLGLLKSIERQFGREPYNRKTVPLDLDIITYGDDVFTSKGKRIPDPDLLKYKYIVLPLGEILADFRHPANGRTIKDIAKSIEDDSRVIKLEEVDNEP